MSGTILPALPAELQALANDRQPAYSTTELVSNLRQRTAPVTKPGEVDLHHLVAEGMERNNRYADDNGNYISLIVKYLQGLTKTADTAGGDLIGTYPDPTVAKIQGNAVLSAAPNNGDLLTWVAANSDWEPVAPTARPTVLHATGGPLTLTTSYADISGVTVTLNRTGTWMIIGTVPMVTDPVDGAMSAQLLVNGAAEADRIVVGGNAVLSLSGNQVWVVSATNGHIAKIQAKKASGAGASLATSFSTIVALSLP